MPKKTKQSVCLNMIVKNEAHVIEKTLNNLVSLIDFSYWVISDTGSTDETKEIIKTFFQNKKIPGELVEHEWKNFGHNRTMALDAAYNKTDYLFIFDADDFIYGDFKLPVVLDRDSYHIKFGKNFQYYRPLLINNRKKWCWKGVLHEFINCLENSGPHGYVQGDYYLDSGKSGDRSKDEKKYLKDALILEKGFNEEQDWGLRDRYAFYCAQSYKDYGDVDKSIEWYSKVLTLNNWNQEKYYSCLSIGDLYARKNDIINALKFWMKSVEYDEDRIEGIVNATEYFYKNGFHFFVNALCKKYSGKKADPSNKLFVYTDKYDYNLDYYNSICAFYLKEYDSGLESCKKVFQSENINNINSTFGNIQFYDLKPDQNFFNYIDDLIFKFDSKNYSISQEAFKLWRKVQDKEKLIKYKPYKFTNKDKPKVMITFTTCKRFDLFQQTINSILNTWEDIDKIDYWFCVDDNSSEEDKKNMKKSYNWIDYYWKTIEEKGHRPSMNIIWNKLKELNPRYWIHMEDDFLFHKKMNYVTTSIKYLQEMDEQNVKQILFNRNYGETIEDYRIKGSTPFDDFTTIHEYREGGFQYHNCHYWPHYSFRPSLIDARVILELGNYDSPNQFFEMDYARKYADKGYKSGFFNRITCTHIGKLTSEKDKANAYILNEESQFVKRDNKIKVVNLVRRPDRREHVQREFQKQNFKNYEFVEAVDGKTLLATEEIKKLFLGNDFGSRRGFFGCALSHYNLWKKLLTDNVDYYIIMEDDFTICNNFWEKIYKTDPKNYDLIFYGYHMFDKEREKVKDIYNVENDETVITKLNKSIFIGGTHCYSVNKEGARKLLSYIEKNGIKHGIDYVIKIVNDLECFESQPHLAFADWNENGKNIDTDIQFNYDSLDLTKDIRDLFEFIPKLDQIGNDILHNKKSIEEMMVISLNNPNCEGFNTLGFFKSKIDNLQNSIYFTDTDGIYVKKNNKIKIKMLCNWTSSEEISKEWSIMNNKKFELTSNNNPDYFVIINKPKENENYDPKKTIIFQMEPWVHDETKNWGVKTWGEWSQPDETKFLHVHSHKKYLNAVQWQIHPPSQFPENKKDKLISIISEKNFDEGHIKRINILKKLDETNFIDVYGRENYHKLTNYIGTTDKKEFAEYKYCFSVENNAEHNYATEKIWEPILHEMLCFYWGCPNLEDYIDSQAFVRLDLDNVEESINIIGKAIEEDWWSQRIDIIRKEKEKILHELGFFPTLEKIINNTSQQ